MSRETYVQSHLPDIGLDSFPDDVEVRWHRRGTWHEGSYCLVEAEPVPATVGYPRFRFVLHFATEAQASVAGCYALIEGRWALLFSSPGASPEWRGLFKSVL
jgi:hypothetical protein